MTVTKGTRKLVVLVLALASPLAFAEYPVEVVEGSESDIVFYTSLEYNGGGMPTIAYGNRTASEVRLATKSADSTWSRETVAPVEPQNLDHAIDSNGNILVCYTTRENPTYALYVAERVGGTWSRTRVARAIKSLVVSCAYGPGHVASVVYADSSKVYLAKRSGSTWSSEVVAQKVSVGVETSLAYDLSGKPAIAFVDDRRKNGVGSTYLKLARKPGSKWSIEQAASSSNLIRHASLVFAPLGGGPMISYSPVPIGMPVATYLATSPATGMWVSELIANAYGRSLAVDAGDTLYIGLSVVSLPKQVFFSSKAPGGLWMPEVLETGPDDAGYIVPSTALDPTGHPAFSYGCRTDGYSFYDLRFASWVP
ncbi:MAG: hypothetical protein KBD01_18620 [Acidobacteria bacterium]|nr:hypothetical protein [Acidobacteriota bacterium]